MKRLDNGSRTGYHTAEMERAQIFQQRVRERRERLALALEQAARVATARVARGSVCLQLGRFVTEKDLQERRSRFARAVSTMA